MPIYAVHKDGKPIVTKGQKKQPKVYLEERYAKIAISNMIPNGRNLSQKEYDEELRRYEIVPYVPQNTE